MPTLVNLKQDPNAFQTKQLSVDFFLGVWGAVEVH